MILPGEEGRLVDAKFIFKAESLGVVLQEISEQKLDIDTPLDILRQLV